MIKVVDKGVMDMFKRIRNDKHIKKQVLQDIGEFGKQELVKRAELISTSNTLANSFSYKVDGMNDRVTIKSSADYALNAMEYGRKPGRMPPYKALKTWAAKKLGDERLAYAVAKKIGERGTQKYRKGGPKLVTRAVNLINNNMDRFLNKITAYYD